MPLILLLLFLLGPIYYMATTVGLFSGWSVGVELAVRLHERGVCRREHIHTTSEDDFWRCTSAHSALEAFSWLATMQEPAIVMVRIVRLSATHEYLQN